MIEDLQPNQYKLACSMASEFSDIEEGVDRMEDKINVKAFLTGLSMLGVIITAAVFIVLILVPDDDALTETASIVHPIGGKEEDSSRSESVHITNTPGVIGEEPAPSEASPPEIDDPPREAELSDLQFIADRKRISLREAIDRYGWNDNFALAVSRIREASPATFAGAEIVDGAHAWIAFTGHPPKAALDMIHIFTSSHSGVSVEVCTDLSFTEAELEIAIPAVHYAVLEAPGVRNASTSFDPATGQIRTIVVLEGAASDSQLDDLRDIAEKRLIDVTRSDILESIAVVVVRSQSPVLGGDQ